MSCDCDYCIKIVLKVLTEKWKHLSCREFKFKFSDVWRKKYAFTNEV